MSQTQQIRDALKNITGTQKKQTIIFSAKVIRVLNKVCDVEYNGMTITGVKLSPVLDSSNTSVMIKPTPNSYITVIDASMGDLRDLYAILFTDVSDIIIDEGKNGGLIKIKELTDKINGLVGTVNALVQAYNSHIHTTTAVDAAGKPCVINPIVNKATGATELQRNEYENIKIKH